ncbi:hypothetical protein A1O1_09263 [Capronia coronata CBS 617.96]|uniref:Enoyl reductase (ER) domain-containing protein n=1 Tax=Capronia coronata CBS 617.96 TaxID=1182541 RepID=W9XPJ0_9EURO|nr:uncharacterized protein A1O1_09263 [Capronia coronata CBS 617.96]EXJ78861.1 hypothetical protein A1O1_09263 [Capronia coronata CBS 617.96]
MPTNRAAWVKTRQSPTMVIESAPYTLPDANELVIRARAVAVNPADVGIQAKGVLLTTDEQYPAILGCDVAGEVVEVHPSLSDLFREGDRVIGQTTPLATKDGVYCYSSFQEYVVLKMPSVAKIPGGQRFEDATVLPLGFNTAASCLFAAECLGLRTPPTQRPTPAQETRDAHGQGGKEVLLVWGASSSVGSCGVQLARLAGYEVIATASARNHDMVKQRLSATACFDQSDPALVDKVVNSLQGKHLVGVYDAISTDATLAPVCEILDRAPGARKLVAAVMPGCEAKSSKGVRITTNFVTTFVDSGLARALWTWLEETLQDGGFKCMPPAEVVGHGLEHVQEAVDLLAKGVSAKKLVVTI